MLPVSGMANGIKCYEEQEKVEEKELDDLISHCSYLQGLLCRVTPSTNPTYGSKVYPFKRTSRQEIKVKEELMCDKCNEGTPVIKYSMRDELIHWEICETDEDCEIWIKRSPWCNTQASIKLAWPIRNGANAGTVAYGGEIPLEVLPQFLTFAIKHGFLKVDHPLTRENEQ